MIPRSTRQSVSSHWRKTVFPDDVDRATSSIPLTSRIDLHCHYLPAVDDGVRTTEEGVELLRLMKQLGYRKVVATPHMRTAMFPNSRGGLETEFETFRKTVIDEPALPELGLASEHYFDDVFWQRFHDNEVLPYPGGQAILVELPPKRFPVGLENAVFRMGVRGRVPVLAHPERYEPLFRNSKALDPLLSAGAVAQLDLLSLVGHYGAKPRKAAERMLEEGVYHLACSDCHRPKDVDLVRKAIELLQSHGGPHLTQRLLETGPASLLHDSAGQSTPRGEGSPS